VDRRHFLQGGGAVLGSALAAACGDTGPTPALPAETTAVPQLPSDAQGDAAVAELAAGLERLIAYAYAATRTAADAGRLGPVPEAFLELVIVARNHHDEYRGRWNTRLREMGRPPVDTPLARLKPLVDSELTGMDGFPAAAKLALTLEEVAADTYNRAVVILEGDDAVRLAAQIQVVAQQRRSMLLYMLGMDPVPEVFQDVDKAASI
jgi:hypothetical protein